MQELVSAYTASSSMGSQMPPSLSGPTSTLPVVPACEGYDGFGGTGVQAGSVAQLPVPLSSLIAAAAAAAATATLQVAGAAGGRAGSILFGLPGSATGSSSSSSSFSAISSSSLLPGSGHQLHAGSVLQQGEFGASPSHAQQFSDAAATPYRPRVGRDDLPLGAHSLSLSHPHLLTHSPLPHNHPLPGHQQRSPSHMHLQAASARPTPDPLLSSFEAPQDPTPDPDTDPPLPSLFAARAGPPLSLAQALAGGRQGRAASGACRGSSSSSGGGSSALASGREGHLAAPVASEGGIQLAFSGGLTGPPAAGDASGQDPPRSGGTQMVYQAGSRVWEGSQGAGTRGFGACGSDSRWRPAGEESKLPQQQQLASAGPLLVLEQAQQQQQQKESILQLLQLQQMHQRMLSQRLEAPPRAGGMGLSAAGAGPVGGGVGGGGVEGSIAELTWQQMEEQVEIQQELQRQIVVLQQQLMSQHVLVQTQGDEQLLRQNEAQQQHLEQLLALLNQQQIKSKQRQVHDLQRQQQVLQQHSHSPDGTRGHVSERSSIGLIGAKGGTSQVQPLPLEAEAEAAQWSTANRRRPEQGQQLLQQCQQEQQHGARGMDGLMPRENAFVMGGTDAGSMERHDNSKAAGTVGGDDGGGGGGRRAQLLAVENDAMAGSQTGRMDSIDLLLLQMQMQMHAERAAGGKTAEHDGGTWDSFGTEVRQQHPTFGDIGSNFVGRVNAGREGTDGGEREGERLVMNEQSALRQRQQQRESVGSLAYAPSMIRTLLASDLLAGQLTGGMNQAMMGGSLSSPPVTSGTGSGATDSNRFSASDCQRAITNTDSYGSQVAAGMGGGGVVQEGGEGDTPQGPSGMLAGGYGSQQRVQHLTSSALQSFFQSQTPITGGVHTNEALPDKERDQLIHALPPATESLMHLLQRRQEELGFTNDVQLWGGVGEEKEIP